MRKVFLPIFIIFCLLITASAFWLGRRSNVAFEYILLNDRQLLASLDVDEIYINHIKFAQDNAIAFNGYRTYEFLTDKNQTASFLPTQNYDKIKMVVECVKNAQKAETRGKLNDILFFRDGRKIYYTYIGWDEEKIYGDTWQSESFIEIIDQWKQDLLYRYNSMLKRADMKKVAEQGVISPHR